MALGTYSELQAEVASWLFGRTDLTDRIKVFITMAEARFNREIRTVDMEATATLTFTSGAATVPTGLRAVRSIYLTADPYGKLEYQPPDWLDDADPEVTSAPKYYTRVGAQFLCWPPITASAKIRYRGGIAALADDNTTNWLLTKHPDLYLAATLAAAFAFTKDEPRLQVWETMAAAMISQINREDVLQFEDGQPMQPGTAVV